MIDFRRAGRRHGGAGRRTAHVAWFGLVLAWVSALVPAMTMGAQAPQLHTDTAIASAGYYRLTWDWPKSDNRQFQLQESRSDDFADAETVYTGPDRATLMSGRSDGQFYYRVRLQPEDGTPGLWSESVTVHVEHHSLGRAVLFFGIGAVVFVATLALIVGGNHRSRKWEQR